MKLKHNLKNHNFGLMAQKEHVKTWLKEGIHFVYLKIILFFIVAIFRNPGVEINFQARQFLSPPKIVSTQILLTLAIIVRMCW